MSNPEPRGLAQAESGQRLALPCILHSDQAVH